MDFVFDEAAYEEFKKTDSIARNSVRER